MDKILFIDGMNAIHRACIKFGTPPIKQVDDSIIFTYNFFRNLRPIIEMFAPDKCYFVLEGHPKFRYDLFSDYKASRIVKYATAPEKVERFNKTRDLILSLLPLLPITMCRAANYEADDLVATLCDNMKEENLTVLSNDSDYIQLLQRGYKQIQIYNPIKKIYMEAPNYPYVAWKSLAGDKSDSIPSLLKPKKVMEAIDNPLIFEEFMNNQENFSNFQRNRQLIEFRSVPEDEIIIQEGVEDFAALKTKFNEMEFESMTNDLSWERYTSTFSCIQY